MKSFELTYISSKYFDKEIKYKTKSKVFISNSKDDVEKQFKELKIKYLEILEIKEMNSNCLGNIYPILQKLKNEFNDDKA